MPRSAAAARPPRAAGRGPGAGRAGLSALAAGLVLLLLLPATAQADPTPPAAPVTAAPSAAPGASAAGPYVVTLAEAPVATYVGGLPGLAGTSPARGSGLDLATPRALDYRSYLRRRQAQVAGAAGVRPTQRYTVALNGFAVRLTPDQVRRLRATPGVVRVSPDALVHVTDQSRNVDYLKLSGARGLWHTLGGRSRSGRGVVVGVVDTGIWPESASFAGHALATTAPPASDRYRAYRVGSQIRMRKADGHLFTGTCESGQRFTARSCSTKLVGARSFGAGWLAGVAAGDVDDFRSPRDGDGHGTHTASTAVGDADVPATVAGKSAGRVSGVAPGAVVASYKALWTSVNQEQSGGVVSDLVAAVEAAVTDGVDVLNYSVGSTSESGLDAPVEQAFLAAAAAGVFVATSAGNSGPTAATLDHPSPWVTTVAASTMAPRSHVKKPVYPQIASFSSRGPSVADQGDLVKPDLAAPGVDVLAALAPRRSTGPRFGYLSGTSMAAPQVAGLAALYLGRYPSTGPMAVKSALMTTAAPTRTPSGSASANAYAQGSGVVRADRMLAPAVVVDSGLADWQGYLEGHGVATGSGLAAVDPSDFNAPSIAVGRLAGSQTVTRRLTATRAGRVTLAAAVPGFEVVTRPSRMTFTAAGQTRTLRVTFTRTTAPLLRPAFGSLTVRGATATSRLPIALTPSLLDAPAEIVATGASGARTLTLRSGVAGELTTTAYGLARGHLTRGSVGVQDDGTPARSTVPVPRGTRLVRLALAADEPEADIDLYVYAEVDGEMSLVAESAGLSGHEEVTLPAPEAGSYVVEVVPAADPPGQARTGYALTRYLLGPTADSLRVTPGSQPTVPGRPVTVQVSWSGLPPGRYLGSLAYAGPWPTPHQTLVQVQVD